MSYLALPIAAVFCFAACGDDEDLRESNAEIRVIHGSFDAADVDVAVDGVTFIENLSYAESSGYLLVAPGARRLEVRAAGSPQPIATTQLTLEAAQRYTVLAYNRAAELELLVVEDPAEPPENRALVSVIHATPDAPAIDVRPDSATADPLFEDLSFGNATPYAEVPEGDYSFVLTPTGETTTVAAFESFEIDEGNVYTIIALGTVEPADQFDFGLRVFSFDDNGTEAEDLTPVTTQVE